ncbi:phosphatase PAP2 family protein [Streptomyces sp. AJS327]|uniref:phosphatase PAP2 family protein n=1 Tax=Streptomyces sp. AJS327 TaxID=2545265 RepID=UPI0015DE8DF4|nr:phosphatase PAP2 family protein [Streptomyces sp. AJS327]MBA0052537.1 phosphatase PAP2 family protein [Streptomyces sp. AJS327]
MDGQPARPARFAVTLTLLALVPLTLVSAGWRPLLELDRRVAVALHEIALAHSGWTRANRILTDWVWDPWTMRLLLTAAVGLLLWRGLPWLALWVAGTAVATTAVQQLLKAAVGRERPRWAEPVDTAQYAAMPSGHAMTAAVTGVLLLWLVRLGGARGRTWGCAVAVAGLSVAGVAFTRVALGVHWLTDTLVGTLLGAASGLGAVALWNLRERRASRDERGVARDAAV